MLRVGLTGGIASGKSTVSAVLRRLGAPVIDADRLVHLIYEPGSETVATVAQEFGSTVLRPDGGIDRGALAGVVFGDESARRKLEAIVHPAVRLMMRQEAAEYEQQGHPVCFFDIPLLIETGLYKQFDRVWVVYVDRETQARRLMARNGFTPEEAERRIAAQMPLDAKRGYAHAVIDNRGTPAETEMQVRQNYEALMAEVRRH